MDLETALLVGNLEEKTNNAGVNSKKMAKAKGRLSELEGNWKRESSKATE